jgi:hypothetical protein
VYLLFHSGVLAMLLLSFAQASFHHAHASDPHHEHAQGFAHTHWRPISESQSWQTDTHDSDARVIDWIAGDGSSPAKLVIALPDSLYEIVVAVCLAHVPELTPHNHDPPSRLSPNPRGPPA